MSIARALLPSQRAASAASRSDCTLTVRRSSVMTGMRIVSDLAGFTLAQADSLRRAIGKKIPEKTIRVFPFPVRPSAARRSLDLRGVRSRLGLDPALFTVLISFGAEGVGPVRAYLRALMADDAPIQIVVVCGRNRILQNRLSKDVAASRGRARIVVTGFVANLPDYVAAADIVARRKRFLAEALAEFRARDAAAEVAP